MTQTTHDSTRQDPAISASSTSAVVVRGLRVRYGDFEAVRGIDLDIRRGEVFALLGTNGAGKTTTLDVLAGFGAPSTGVVEILGLDPRDRPLALRERMGVQLQDGGFVEELTVLETMRLWQQLVSRPDRPERLLDRFELRGRRDVPVGKLSGGEQRRLDLALALWGSPELVILDEPTTGLDPEARSRTWDAIQELQDAGRTVLLTTHYLEEAEALADRVAIMHEGRIAVAGTLAEIVAAQPARFSATLPAGAPVLPDLDGWVERSGDRVTVRSGDLQRDLTTFLTWAQAHGVRLGDDLRAAPASLADIYHSVRAEPTEEETTDAAPTTEEPT
ncbi:MAG: ABC transporter ATP-binding protein, partial [Pseudonocardia sp.]|nr:ABC transporter ATP-binding protein [Pseudonocardia sp.]